MKNLKHILSTGLLLAGLMYLEVAYAQLTIDPGGLVAIKNGSSMQIDMDLKINAINGSSGYFSDQTTSSGGVDITGNVSVERYMVADIWHNVAPPVDSENSSVYTGTNLIWYYDETLILNDWNFGWVLFSGPLGTFRAYDVLFQNGDVLVDYTGAGNELNTGPFSRAVTITNSTPTETPEHKGWNLMANPYPSPINWQTAAGYNKTSINDAKYIWDGSNDIYTIWLGGGAPIGINGGTRYIPSNQGFWVQAVSNGTFGINNAARTGFMAATPDFYKSTEQFDYPLLSLVVKNNQHSDEAVIRFIEGNSEKFDVNYDASKLFSRNDKVPQISIVSGKDILALNTFSQIEDDLEIPVYFKCAGEGYFTLEIAERTNLLPGIAVYLKDEQTDEVINLSDAGQYFFYHDPFNAEDRFKIIFNPNPDIINNLKPENYFSVYSNRNKVVLVKNSVKKLNGKVSVYNMQGKLVFAKELSVNRSDSFTLHVEPGYYIVQINTQEAVNNSKVIITK